MPYNSETRKEGLKEELYKLECILKCGYILPYRYTKKIYPNISRHPYADNNGNTGISICRHDFGKQEEYDEEYLRTYRYRLIEYAFDMFPAEETSIVLNESIKDNLNIVNEGIYLERIVKEPIPLKYMDAISINVTEEIMPYFPTLESKEAGCISDAYFTLDYLRKVRKLLTQYKYDIPIVSVMTGNEFQDPGKVKTIEKTR